MALVIACMLAVLVGVAGIVVGAEEGNDFWFGVGLFALIASVFFAFAIGMGEQIKQIEDDGYTLELIESDNELRWHIAIALTPAPTPTPEWIK